MSHSVAIVYHKNILAAGLLADAFCTNQQPSVNLVAGHRHGDGHVIDHAGHAIDVGDKLSASRVSFNRNATWLPVHRSSILGVCNGDAVRSHNPGLAETPPCIPVTA